MKMMVVFELGVVVQLIELFQKFPRRDCIIATSSESMYWIDPLIRSMFHPGESWRAGVAHCESSMV